MGGTYFCAFLIRKVMCTSSLDTSLTQVRVNFVFFFLRFPPFSLRPSSLSFPLLSLSLSYLYCSTFFAHCYMSDRKWTASGLRNGFDAPYISWLHLRPHHLLLRDKKKKKKKKKNFLKSVNCINTQRYSVRVCQSFELQMRSNCC